MILDRVSDVDHGVADTRNNARKGERKRSESDAQHDEPIRARNNAEEDKQEDNTGENPS